MDNKKFLNDMYIKDIVASLYQYDVVSFDVFDTLLFRTVDEPIHVFKALGESIQKEYPEYVNTPIAVLSQLRITAEQRARKKAKSIGKDDVTLEEICNELHIFGDRVHRIMELEQLAEQGHVYVNPNMYSFAEHCYEQGKNLAIVSDFYFSKEQLTKLLIGAGINTAIFSAILVSSEYKVTKSSGKLFHKLLKSFPGVPASRILHIGDNQNADIMPAQDIGIQVCWYPVVPETRRGIIDMERCCYGSTVGSLSCLRSLAMNTIPESITGEESRFWFRTGSGILGPVLSLYAEWVVDTAIKENVKNILPFMREGELLAELIKRAAANRSVDLIVTPFFISRKSSALLAEPAFTKETIEEALFSRSYLYIGDLFSTLYMDIEETVYAKLSNLTIQECKNNGCFEEIAEYFLNEKIISQINENISQQREYLADYARSFISSNATITVDFMCHGTIQRGFSGALKSCGYENKIIHLILVGPQLNVDLLLDGIDIRGFLGYAGENAEILTPFRAYSMPLEVMASASIGRTMSYRNDAGSVVPVLEEKPIPKYDVDARRTLWDGIYRFQAYWLYLKNVSPKCFEMVVSEKKAVLSIFSRLFLLPSNIEAVLIGALSFEDGIFFGHSGSFVGPKELELLKQSNGIDEFLINPLRDGQRVFWPHAVVEQASPNCFFNRYLKEKIMQPGVLEHHVKLFNFILSNVIPSGRVGLYGFGLKGRSMMKLLWTMGLHIEAIIDKSQDLHSLQAYGIKIISPEQSVGLVDTYIISTLKYSDEIKRDIETLHAGKKQPDILVFD
jgi:predicted HAD superfamily hydrolase